MGDRWGATGWWRGEPVGVQMLGVYVWRETAGPRAIPPPAGWQVCEAVPVRGTARLSRSHGHASPPYG